MKGSIITFILVLLFTFGITRDAFPNGASYPDDEYYPMEENGKMESGDMMTEDELGPDPQRMYCKQYWNSYYSERNIDIDVTTRGKYDEVVVFSCPECSLEENYVEPFLKSETGGLTGEDRIRACGFKKAVFVGAKGIREIERDI